MKLDEGDEVEAGQSAFSTGVWSWAIDTVIPMRTHLTQNEGNDRKDCMRRFRVAWDHFAADVANLVEFMDAKRKRR